MLDQETFQRIKQGDRTALEKIYIENRDSVINWITRKHRCSLEEAKDIYQDAIVIFYNNTVKGKIPEINFSISSYLHEIVRRQFLSKLKKESKMSRGVLDLIEDQSMQIEEDTQEYQRKMDIVHRAMQELSDTCKKLIELRYFTELTMESICELLGYKNPDTAKNLKYKCMRILRRKVSNITRLGIQL